MCGSPVPCGEVVSCVVVGCGMSPPHSGDATIQLTAFHMTADYSLYWFVFYVYAFASIPRLVRDRADDKMVVLYIVIVRSIRLFS